MPVEQTARFLDGKSTEIVRSLADELLLLSWNFEQAAGLRNRRRPCSAPPPTDGGRRRSREQDVIAVATEGDKALVALLQVRGGRLLRNVRVTHTKGRSVGDHRCIHDATLLADHKPAGGCS